MKERLKEGKKITLEKLRKRAGCSYAQAHNLLIDQVEVLLWVIRPIGDNEVMVRVGVEQTLRELAEISALPLDLEKGMSAYQLATLKLKIFKMIYPIVHPPTQAGERDPDQEK